ncbi:MAG TPA: 3'-5' exonuclease [Leptospiraceae bacterium]|nr:3'-5' exonuclease [Leptospiraceae bacterium]
MSIVQDWARNTIEENALVLDIESTGGSFSDEMIDLGIVDISTMEVIYSSLLKPTALLNVHAQKVHGITYEMLRRAPFLEDEAIKINSILQNRKIITYNVNFDKRLFYQSYNRYRLDFPENTVWECLMEKCTKYFNSQLKLDVVCDNLNLKKGNHRAAPDALAAARVLKELAK